MCCLFGREWGNRKGMDYMIIQFIIVGVVVGFLIGTFQIIHHSRIRHSWGFRKITYIEASMLMISSIGSSIFVVTIMYLASLTGWF